MLGLGNRAVVGSCEAFVGGPKIELEQWKEKTRTWRRVLEIYWDDHVTSSSSALPS